MQNLPSDLVLAAEETLTTANSKAITARNAHDEVVAFFSIFTTYSRQPAKLLSE